MLKLPVYHDFAKMTFTKNGFEFAVSPTSGNTHLLPEVDVKEVLSEIFTISGNHLSEPLIEYAAAQLKMNTSYPYVVKNYRGYSPNIMRRDISLKDPKEIYKKLYFFLENQYSLPDDEREDISMYLYGKGCSADATDNLTDAIVYQLGKEKGRKFITQLPMYSKASLGVIDFKDISDIQTGSYNMIGTREPLSPFEEGLSICGVLSQTENGYRLLDGRHRIKHEIMLGADTGTFIILS